MGSRWALRVHAVCEWFVWVACMNALWLVGVLAGAVVFGIGPASAAVAVLTRRRLRGESVRLVRDYASAWARGFLASQLAGGMPLVGAALIALQAAGHLDDDRDPWAALLSIAAAFAFAVSAVSLTMHAHYELRALSHVVTASRWLLHNPGPALLLMATAVAVAAATATLPALALVFTGGAWFTISTALCLGFFAANDAALTATNEGVHS